MGNAIGKGDWKRVKGTAHLPLFVRVFNTQFLNVPEYDERFIDPVVLRPSHAMSMI